MESDLYLFIDDREHIVIDELNKFPNDIQYIVKRLDISDYVIMQKDESGICAIFERKTLNDQCSSMMDGRNNNTLKLLETRNKTNCDIYYIIEKCSYNGGIPLDNVYTSFYNLMINHKIQLLFTDSPFHTAELMIKLLNIYSKNSHKNTISMKDLSGDICDKKVIIDMWSSISGITRQTANLLKKYKFIDYLRNDADFCKNINSLKYENGKPVMANIRMTLTTPKKYDMINSISKCRGITDSIAEFLCDDNNKIDWLKITGEELKNIKVNNRKLGKYGEKFFTLINSTF